MVRFIVGVVMLVTLGTGATWAQPPPISGDSSLDWAESERFSPNYYTVRNIFRTHRRLTPAPPPMASGFVAGPSIPIGEVELDSDVVFRGGVYEFHARIQDAVAKVHLHRRDGRWILDVIDDFNDWVLALYVLEH